MKKIFSLALALSLALSICQFHINADNTDFICDDFESYSNKAGSSWYGQVPGKTEDVPLADKGRGNSAMIVSQPSKMKELLSCFPAAPKDIENIDFEYSILFQDNLCVRAFYVKNDKDGEMCLVKFNTDGTVTVGDLKFSSRYFKYDINKWYDVHISYNICSGYTIVDIYSDGAYKCKLSSMLKKDLSQLYRIDFVNFASSGTNSVTYIDDVYVHQGEKTNVFADSAPMFDNFERNISHGKIEGYENISNSLSSNPFDWSTGDNGKYAIISAKEGTSSIKTDKIKMLQNADMVNIEFDILEHGKKSIVSVCFGDVAFLKVDFADETVTIGEIFENVNLKKANISIRISLNNITGEFNLDINNVQFTGLASGINYDFFEFKVYNSDSVEENVKLDNLAVYPSVVSLNTEYLKLSENENNNFEVFNEDFSNYTDSSLKGWIKQISPANDTDSIAEVKNGGVSIKNKKGIFEFIKEFEPLKNTRCINIKSKIKLCDNNSSKAFYVRDGNMVEIPVLTFNALSDTVNVCGSNVPNCDFSYKIGITYDINLFYNLESGYVRITFTDEDESITIERYARSNVTDVFRSYFVSFGNTMSAITESYLYSFALYSVDPVYELRVQKHNDNGEDFETYNHDLPYLFSSSVNSGSTVSPDEGIFGTNVKLYSNRNSSCALKRYCESSVGKVYTISFNVNIGDTNSDRVVRINGIQNNGTKVSNDIINFKTGGRVYIGNTLINAEDMVYTPNSWYYVKLKIDNESKDVKAEIESATFSKELHGTLSYNFKTISNIELYNGLNSGDVSFANIDNFYFSSFGLIDITPRNSLNADADTIKLEFSDDVSTGNVMLSGSTLNVSDLKVSGNTAELKVFGLKENQEYIFSYSGFITPSGENICGYRKIKTCSFVEICESGFKKPNAVDNRIAPGEMSMYVRAKSNKGNINISLITALYSQDKSKMIDVRKKAISLDENIKDEELIFEIPKEYDRITVKGFIWDNDGIKPITDFCLLNPYVRPSGKDVIDKLRAIKKTNSHPRTIGNYDDFNTIRRLISTDNNISKWYNEVKIDTDIILSNEPVAYSLSDGVRLDSSNIVRDRVIKLGFMYNITGNEMYAQKLYEELENAANYKDWNPNHFIDTATMINAFAIGYDLTYDYINRDVNKKNIIVSAVRDLGFEPLLDDYLDRSRKRTYYWTETNEPDNWNIVCNSCGLIGAVVFADELSEYSKTIIDYAMPSIEKALNRFAPDGAWFEGLDYWKYELSFFIDLLCTMDNSLGTDYGLSNFEGFDKTGYYPFALSGSQGIFNFHDCSEGYFNCSEAFYFSKKYNNSFLQQLEIEQMNKYSISGCVQSIMFYVPTDPNSNYTMPLDFYYKDTEVCTMRSGYNDNDTFIGFHAGRNGIPHGHLDVGEFILDMQGERFAMALGPEDYNLNTTYPFEPYRMRAEGHNTIVINPDINPDQSSSADTIINRFETKKDEAFAVCDMTSAYRDDVTSALRGVRLTENRNVAIIRDEIKGNESFEFLWFMHTRADINISQDKKTAILSLNGKRVVAKIMGNNSGEFEKSEAKPLPSSPQNDKQTQNTGVNKLVINLKNKTDVKVTVAIYPYGYTPQKSYSEDISNW